jgi:hypothetical protein
VEEFAQTASFQRPNIFVIAEDAAEQCASEIELSTQSLEELAKQNGSEDMTISREHVSARTRISAWELVIRRLEAGEAVAVPAGLNPSLGDAQTRFIECPRSAGGIKFSSVFFGDDWLTETLKQGKPKQIAAFKTIGRDACPQSYRWLLEAAKRSAKGRSRAEKEKLEVELESLEEFAATVWLRNAQQR